MADRSKDWMELARRDLGAAEELRTSKRHEWACFAAHQSAEKAVKALHLRRGQEARGHVVARLLSELPADLQPSALLVDRARVLDTFYIPARYPDAHPEGAPFEHYGELQSQEAVGHAREILGFVAAQMA